MSGSGSTYPRSFSSFLSDYQASGPTRFAAEVDTPVLLLRSVERSESDDDTPAFETRLLSRTEAHAAATRDNYDEAPSIRPGDVLRVGKRSGGAFPDRIGIGRAPNVDVRVALPLVSKYHAYFERNEGGWTLTDAGSSNGTFVRGLRLESRKATSIFDGDDLGLGPYRLTFYLPSTFVQMVRGRASGR